MGTLHIHFLFNLSTMSRKNQQFKQRNKSSKLKKLITNVSMGLLSILVMGFFISSIDRLFFNDGLNTEFPDLSTLITQTQYEKDTGHKIQIEIWNGCGIPKLAGMYSNYLRSEGIDVLDSKNADNFNYIKTKILHHRGAIERALTLAELMMINKDQILEDKNETLFFDLTLILGKDYMDLPSYRNALMHQQPF